MTRPQTIARLRRNRRAHRIARSRRLPPGCGGLSAQATLSRAATDVAAAAPVVAAAPRDQWNLALPCPSGLPLTGMTQAAASNPRVAGHLLGRGHSAGAVGHSTQERTAPLPRKRLPQVNAPVGRSAAAADSGRSWLGAPLGRPRVSGRGSTLRAALPGPCRQGLAPLAGVG